MHGMRICMQLCCTTHVTYRTFTTACLIVNRSRMCNHLFFLLPDGYRSVVAYLGSSSLVLTCGTDSCDYSYDVSADGFAPMASDDGEGFYAVAAAKDGTAEAYATGNDGRLAKLTFNA